MVVQMQTTLGRVGANKWAFCHMDMWCAYKWARGPLDAVLRQTRAYIPEKKAVGMQGSVTSGSA